MVGPGPRGTFTVERRLGKSVTHKHTQTIIAWGQTFLALAKPVSQREPIQVMT